MTQDDALRQACENVIPQGHQWLFESTFTPEQQRYIYDAIEQLAKAQRAAGYEAAANVVEGCQVPIGTDAARDYRNDEQRNLALWVLAQKIREASAKEYES